MPPKQEKFDAPTRQIMEARGWVWAKGEHWSPGSKHAHDFGGFADAVMWSPLRGPTGSFVALQITDVTHKAARLRKICNLGTAAAWLLAKGDIWLALWTIGRELLPNKAGRLSWQRTEKMDIRPVSIDDFARYHKIEDWQPAIPPAHGDPSGPGRCEVAHLNQYILELIRARRADMHAKGQL